METSFTQPSSTQHFLADSPCSLSELIKTKLSMDDSALNTLFSLGAIFVNKERTFSDQKLSEQDYIRIHPHPKRYNTESVNWSSTLVFENEAFILVNKPSGIPVHATLDNSIENVAYQLSRALGYPLYVTQRLDVPVSGLLLLAKTQNFQSEFNRFLRQKRVTKHYRALTQKEPATGLHTHFMEKSPWAPKVISSQPSPERLQCDLEILKTSPNTLGFESHIHLLTGRTHQIRAQLSFLGCPILGDSTYGGELGVFSFKKIALHASYLAFKDFEFVSVPPWASL